MPGCMTSSTRACSSAGVRSLPRRVSGLDMPRTYVGARPPPSGAAAPAATGFHGPERGLPADDSQRRGPDAPGPLIPKEETVSTILIGVDDSARSEDAVAFARRLAGATTGRIVVACAFPYSDV